MPTKKVTEKKQKVKAKPIKAQSDVGVEVSIIDTKGNEVEKMIVPKGFFDIKASDKLLAQYVRVYLANQRQGTRSALTRAEVVGSTKKIYKQKGTGRARHGTRKVSLFVGGGVTFGPKPNDFSLKFNKKQRRKALLYALTKRHNEKSIVVVKGLLELSGKTKEIASAFDTIKKTGTRLIIYPQTGSERLYVGARNIKGVTTSAVSLLNAYEVIKNQTIIFAKEALDDFIKQPTYENK